MVARGSVAAYPRLRCCTEPAHNTPILHSFRIQGSKPKHFTVLFLSVKGFRICDQKQVQKFK